MPRERVRTDTVYRYDELSDAAKERAKQWWAEANTGDNFFAESVTEDFATLAGFCGWDINQRPVKLMGGGTRYEPAVYWSGFCSQGDGACFEGSWSAQRVSVTKLRQYAPKNRDLLLIARTFRNIAHRERMATGSSQHRGHYYHEHCTVLDLQSNRERQDRPDFAETVEAWREASRDLMRWYYRALEREYEYQFNGDGFEETMRANEYEFTEKGARA